MVAAHPARINTLSLGKILARRVEPIFTSSALMGLIRSNGGIVYNATEDDYRWRVRHKRHQVERGDPHDATRSFVKKNRYLKAELPIRHYHMGTSYGRLEALLSRGKGTLLYNEIDESTKAMAEDFVEGFRMDLYEDGNAGTQLTIHGLESWLSENGLLSGGYIGEPNDSYAGLNTELGYYGGTFSGTWPDGVSTTPEYSAFSPIITDWNSAQFGTNGWANNWQKALNFHYTYQASIRKDKPDITIMANDLLRIAKDSLIGKTTFEITQTSKMTDLGFDTLSYNGQEIVTEFGVPSEACYILTSKHLQMRCVTPTMLYTEQDSDIVTAESLKSVAFWGNLLCYSPAFHGRLKKITADT